MIKTFPDSHYKNYFDPTGLKTRDLELKGLGFKDYEEFLYSEFWINKKENLNMHEASHCVVCGINRIGFNKYSYGEDSYSFLEKNIFFVLHHKSYLHLSNERAEDLMIVCNHCHNKIHEVNKI